MTHKTLRRLLILMLLLPLPAQATSGWVAVDESTRIHYLDAGPHNNAPVIILIPGWRFGAGVWKGADRSFLRRTPGFGY